MLLRWVMRVCEQQVSAEKAEMVEMQPQALHLCHLCFHCRNLLLTDKREPSLTRHKQHMLTLRSAPSPHIRECAEDARIALSAIDCRCALPLP